MPALTIQLRHCLCMLQSPPSHHQMCCRCAAGDHCQGGWAAGASDCSKDMLELPVVLATGHQRFSSCRLSHMLLSATRAASGGPLELLLSHTNLCYGNIRSNRANTCHWVSKHQADAARSGTQCKWQKMEGPEALGRVRP